MKIEDHATVLLVGSETPWGAMANRSGGASFILNRQVVAALLFQLPADARKDEYALSATGRIDVGVSEVANSIMFTWRFKNDHSSFVFDTPFHIGLEVEGTRQLPIVENRVPLVVVTQDHSGICRSMRMGAFGMRVTSYLASVVKRQISDAERLDFEMDHWAAVDTWNRKFETSAAGHRAALFKERVL